MLPDELTIRFEYSAPRSVEAHMELPELRYIIKYWWPVTLGALGVIFLWQAPYRSLTDFLILFALMSPVTASFVLLPFLMKRSVLSRARRLGRERSDLSEIRSFTPEGFLSAPAWSEPVPWSFITKVVESERFFFVYNSGSDQPEYVPKAAMSDADIVALRDLLKNRLDSQLALLKLNATATSSTGSV